MIHISNTKRTPGRTLSGLDLQKNNLKSISELKKWYPSVKVIQSIYSLEDLERYRSAGADHFLFEYDPLKSYQDKSYS